MEKNLPWLSGAGFFMMTQEPLNLSKNAPGWTA